eukprot:3718119-Pyramimonas_sp.AAC.1
MIRSDWSVATARSNQGASSEGEGCAAFASSTSRGTHLECSMSACVRCSAMEAATSVPSISCSAGIDELPVSTDVMAM